MTQEAVVLKVFENGLAEVAVTRGTACGSNCGNCESCIYANELKAFAVNEAGAGRGQKVIIESESRKIYRAEFIVYILPLVLMIAGYAAAMLAGAREGICILSAFGALIASAVILVVTQRGKSKIHHTITKVISQEGNVL